MLVTALEIDGHEVDEAASAAEGLKRLGEARYNLVLSDYAMPGGTGTWLLSEASRRGLLAGTAAVIVTAHPDVGEIANVEVIGKPFDLDYLMAQVRRILEDAGERCVEASTTGGEALNRGGAPEAGSHLVELVLYVSSASPASIQARRNLERLLSRFDAGQVRCTVRDLGREPLAGEEDRIAFTPTLVKRFPEPRMWVLGNLRDAEVVTELLRGCGVDVRE